MGCFITDRRGLSITISSYVEISNMFEILRDSAFGKLLRIFSGTILLPYPEEAHELAWRTYIQTSADAEQHEESTATSEKGLPQSYGLYTVISQASHRHRRRPSLNSALAGPWRGPKGKTPVIIGWGGPDDSEVRRFSAK